MCCMLRSRGRQGPGCVYVVCVSQASRGEAAARRSRRRRGHFGCGAAVAFATNAQPRPAQRVRQKVGQSSRKQERVRKRQAATTPLHTRVARKNRRGTARGVRPRAAAARARNRGPARQARRGEGARASGARQHSERSARAGEAVARGTGAGAGCEGVQGRQGAALGWGWERDGVARGGAAGSSCPRHAFVSGRGEAVAGRGGGAISGGLLGRAHRLRPSALLPGVRQSKWPERGGGPQPQAAAAAGRGVRQQLSGV